MLTSEHINFFKHLLKERASIENEQLLIHSKDETEDISILPGIVLKPKNVDEISCKT